MKAIWKIADSASSLELHQKVVHYRTLCVHHCIQEYGWDSKNTLLTVIQCLKDMTQAQRKEEQNKLVDETILHLSQVELNEDCEKLYQKIQSYHNLE